MIWLDRRAGDQTERVRRTVPLDRLVEITGNGVDSYYGFRKILWLEEHEPAAWARTRWLVRPNALLIQRLTGELAVDHSSADNIGWVYDIRAHGLSQEACELLGIDRSRLPERLVASQEVVGRPHDRGGELTGLPAGTPVCAGLDAAAATLCAAVLGAGRPRPRLFPAGSCNTWPGAAPTTWGPTRGWTKRRRRYRRAATACSFTASKRWPVGPPDSGTCAAPDKEILRHLYWARSSARRSRRAGGSGGPLVPSAHQRHGVHRPPDAWPA
ncbi:MAG TPA: FGGY family carbohydrate kinase [Acidimicrobiales bacterium]|nr:FGGY family carbohydrate kinase [Acidimicrobiales bacterium]